MSISGAMFAGVSGQRAQSTNLGVISDNIANVNTVGYKGTKAQFETLVTSGTTATTYSPGGVRPHPSMIVDAQGLLNASSSKTDIAIDGAGFFACVSSASVRPDGLISSSIERNFTRAGSFTLSQDGQLVNSAGYTLLGVPTDSKGVPAISNPSVLSMRPVTVGTIVGSSSPTTELKIAAALPGNRSAPSKISISGALNAANAVGPDPLTVQDEASWTVYSSTGRAYQMGIQLNKTSPAAAAAAAPGAQTYNVQATSFTPVGTSPAVTPAPAFPFTLGTITVPNNEPATFVAGGSFTFTDGSTFQPSFNVANLRQGTPTAISRFAVDAEQISTVVYDSLGVAHNMTLEFDRHEPTGATRIGWVAKIVDMRVVATGASSVAPAVAGPPATFDLPIYLDGSAARAGAGAVPPGGSIISFNPNGTLATGAPSNLPRINLTTGAEPFGGTSFSFNLGTPGTKSGMTVGSSEFQLGFIKQNGIPYGARKGVEVDKDGLVRILFSNGQSMPVYKLPVVTFANPNKLEAKSGNVWSETIESGSALSNYSGVGSSGKVSPASLEASTVDLSAEFTNMITTQRFFAANTRSITTADEMLQEVLNMKR